jgi:hypothetical protein
MISPVTSRSDPVSEATGGSAPKEQGDTSPEKFDGTAGTMDVRKPDMQPVILKEIRIGLHPNFDRVVFEFEGTQVPGYRVQYVDKPVRTCGPGEIVQVAGYGYLVVQMMPAQAHTNEGKSTINERSYAPKLVLIKEMRQLCDFESDVQWVLGLTSPNRYRVLELTNPARLVIDVRH